MRLNHPTVLVVLNVVFAIGSTIAFQPTLHHHVKAKSALYEQKKNYESSRRDVLIESAGLALTSFLLVGQRPSNVHAAEGIGKITNNPQTIVITGANSGIGLEACKRLAKQGHNLVLACRTIEKAQAAADSLKELGETGIVVPAECNLASLTSIREFSESLPKMLPGSKIDRLCLNAGIARNTAATDCARTADGFELTVGTNHFGHFYLNHLLLPMVASNGRIVVTASGVHDPESPGGAQGVPASLGGLKGLEELGKDCEMIDGYPFNADKAYKDSKLCNVLFIQELQRRLQSNSNTNGISANCFNPGLIVTTGLFRDQNPIFTKIFDLVATDLVKVGETPSWGGGALAYMTTVDSKGLYYTSPPGSSKYGDAAFGNQFGTSTVSKEAQDDAKAKRFWELSNKVLGIA